MIAFCQIAIINVSCIAKAIYDFKIISIRVTSFTVTFHISILYIFLRKPGYAVRCQLGFHPYSQLFCSNSLIIRNTLRSNQSNTCPPPTADKPVWPENTCFCFSLSRIILRSGFANLLTSNRVLSGTLSISITKT